MVGGQLVPVMLVQYIVKPLLFLYVAIHSHSFKKKYTKIYIFTRITGQYNATLPQTQNRFPSCSSLLRFQVSWSYSGSQAPGAEFVTYVGFHTLSSLTEIQVSNELLACGLKLKGHEVITNSSTRLKFNPN